MTGVFQEAGTACPFRAPEFTPIFSGVSDAHLFSFLFCVFCFVCLVPCAPDVNVSLDCPFWIALRFSLTFIIIMDSLYSLIASSKVKFNNDIRNQYVLII